MKIHKMENRNAITFSKFVSYINEQKNSLTGHACKVSKIILIEDILIHKVNLIYSFF